VYAVFPLGREPTEEEIVIASRLLSSQLDLVIWGVSIPVSLPVHLDHVPSVPRTSKDTYEGTILGVSNFVLVKLSTYSNDAGRVKKGVPEIT
jgi:hypothetical protein